MRLIALIFIAAIAASAQTTVQGSRDITGYLTVGGRTETIRYVAEATGACTGDEVALQTSDNALFRCNAGSWVAIAGGGGGEIPAWPAGRAIYLPELTMHPYQGGQAPIGTNQIMLSRVCPLQDIAFENVGFSLHAGAEGEVCAVALYSEDGQTRHYHQGNIDCSDTGPQSFSVNMTMESGLCYWTAIATSSSSIAVHGVVTMAATGGSELLMQSPINQGRITNGMVEGELPATVTPGSFNTTASFVRVKVW